MGKLLIGHFGQPPEAESIRITLKDCHQRLGMKPSDFVSLDAPMFFKAAHGAKGKYLVFEADASDVGEAAIWQKGFYLLPLEAADVLKAFGQKGIGLGASNVRAFEVECKTDVPLDILDRATQWANQVQPLLFHCLCAELLMKISPPTVFRKQWRARLSCHKRCQPALKTEL